jgi:hypothetical protein
MKHVMYLEVDHRQLCVWTRKGVREKKKGAFNKMPFIPYF